MWLGKDMKMCKDMVNVLEFNEEGQIELNIWDYDDQHLFLLNRTIISKAYLMILDWTLRC